MKMKYHRALVGFEKYSWTEEQLALVEPDLQIVLKDIEACTNCDGDLCRADINHHCINNYWHKECGHPCGPECYSPDHNDRRYYALWHPACDKDNIGFAFFPCPGPAERKEKLLESITAKNYKWEEIAR